MISVSEYTDVTVGDPDVLSGLPWDGATGAVMVILSAGTVMTGNGKIVVDRLGFRGGLRAPNKDVKS
ncbi:hypothetical protein [Pajaroellobacter abortibovis]|uniref:hypothetical protein n=1 Tax=Pajaroellobacter abortibovis TaxID=1882918 RepID=UPI0012EBA1E4|nr:hypothetical protein [Pajaroellobacter abortibovis]